MPNAMEYKCPKCGGRLELSSALQQMKCPYCDAVYPVSDFSGAEAAQAQQSAGWADGFGMYQCSSCGAEIIADASTAATHCPYCDNPVILTDRLSDALKPDYIIPFKVDKKTAKNALREHFHGKRLLPKVFSAENHLDEIKGIYVPYWLYDTTAEASASYRMKNMRSWSDGNYNYTETSNFAATRSGFVSFRKVPVDASQRMDDEMMESLEAFDFNDAIPFDPAYLSGFFADRFDVSSEECLQRIRERTSKTVEEDLYNSVRGFASVQQEACHVSLRDTGVSYALYPVWILNTTWRGKKYVFAMNGQTGKFVGNLPVDQGIYWRRRLLYTLCFGGGAYALLWALGML